MGLPVISRLAPTPSGYLHVGNAYNFLLNWLSARASGGKVLLRIDDLDSDRVRDEYLDDIFRTLERLGLDWDIGPSSVADFKQNWSQTLRTDEYRKTLARLADRGLLFACTCSRKQLEDFATYPRHCNPKQIPLSTPDVAWRLDMEKIAVDSFEDRLWGHVRFETGAQVGCAVLRRRDAVPAYHIASLTDDLSFGVNFIARGMDLLPSTALQLRLAKLLDEPAFARTVFWHHALVSGADGEKLSKSAGATSLKQGREKGLPVSALLRDFARWTGMEDVTDVQTAADLLPFWPPTQTSA